MAAPSCSSFRSQTGSSVGVPPVAETDAVNQALPLEANHGSEDGRIVGSADYGKGAPMELLDRPCVRVAGFEKSSDGVGDGARPRHVYSHTP